MKLIWNKKGSQSLLIIEIWASFMVLFGLLSLVVFNVKNYLESVGFSHENVWSIDLTATKTPLLHPKKLIESCNVFGLIRKWNLLPQIQCRTPFFDQ